MSTDPADRGADLVAGYESFGTDEKLTLAFGYFAVKALFTALNAASEAEALDTRMLMSPDTSPFEDPPDADEPPHAAKDPIMATDPAAAIMAREIIPPRDMFQLIA